ncbi:ATP-dependent RNA helicase RhlE [Streptomyces californicus]
MTGSALDTFSPATRSWFTGAFSAPTPAQEGAWRAIGEGSDVLVVAPTGSGKTLAAFLASLDRLAAEPPPADAKKRCRVLYVSPLKALAVDVERNLRSPLTGIRQESVRQGLPEPEVRVGIRSGDTPPAERRSMVTRPPDILITTPESLFLMLTSSAREALAGVETVILDEVHAVAGTKRGAHLALTLERLDELLARPARRIGLSATVRPVDEVARFLSPQRKVEIVQPRSTKEFDLSVVVPVEDLGELGGSPATDGDSGQADKPSIWPHVEERIADLVQAHRSTIVFANSRRLAERLCNRLNEIAYERATGTAFDPDDPAPALPEAHAPSEIMAQSGAARGAPALLARAHHGSVSKEQRAQVEEDLKAGRLPAVVATSSLELGIDMGAVDLVVQVESPPSVASGLQRVGRAGHQVGAVSTGVVFPKYRGDLVQAAVVTERMREGAIEALRIPSNPLDVLAQQLVAMVALDSWQADDLLALVRRAAPFASLPESAFTGVLDMLAGRYPSDAFAELRPRVVWDRVAGTVTGRPGAQRLAVTSGGTIPDRGLFGVFLAGADPKKGGGRVGELDEEMVYESRVGDVFTLGTTSWRIEDITRDRVLVSPAPGVPGRLPFWKGDQLGRPLELGRALGAFLREIGGLSEEDARLRLLAAGLDAWAADNVLAYLDEQRRACGHVPDDRTILVERFRDELGDWRVVVHSPFGAQVHAPWALALSARLGERYGMDAQVMHADDGIVLRLPEADMMGLDLLDFDAPDGGGDAPAPGAAYDSDQPPVAAADVVFDKGEVEQLVTEQVGGSALFASRFRECAAAAARTASRTGPPTVSGRWSLLPPVEPERTHRAHALARTLLDRHGVVTRGAVQAEGVEGGFSATYRVLAAFEDNGQARRGYVVEGLGAAQFAMDGAVDRLRAVSTARDRRDPETVPEAVVLAAADPANAYGAALPWPESPDGAGHKPGRKAGALVVLVDGELTLYMERGGKTLLAWPSDPESPALRAAAEALAASARAGALGTVTVERMNGVSSLTSPLGRTLEAAGFLATPKGLRLRA